MNDYPKFLFFKPYLKTVLWAGSDLEKVFKEQKNIGEAWIISAYEGKESYCLNEEYHHLHLRELFSKHNYLFKSEQKTYPTLLKIIDAQKSLSVQVHPDDSYAQKHYQSKGKDECWYVLKNEKAPFVYGLDVHSPEAFQEGLKNNVESILHYEQFSADDFLYIAAGRVHAIPQKTTVFELQQSSDITFRLYDFKRLDKDGKLRPLHTQEALATTKFDLPHFVKKTAAKDEISLVRNDYFDLNKYATQSQKEINLPEGKWHEIIIIKGNGFIDEHRVCKYDSLILTNGNHHFSLKGKVTILVNTHYK